MKKLREIVKKKLVDSNQAVVYYELTGPVKSRWLADCVVKIVDNQWFLAYGDEDWTKKTEEAPQANGIYILQNLELSSEYVLQWLNNWACVREKRVGN